MDIGDKELGERIRLLRERCGMSLRKLAELAGVTAGMISCIERAKASPSVVTLQKILSALGTDLATFFAGEGKEQAGPIFSREQMKVVADVEHNYTLIFPRRDDVHVEMLDERCNPTKKKPEYETLQCDVAGYVLSGDLTLEIDGMPKKTLRPGDAFYVPKGVKHRGYVKSEPVRLITVYSPPRY